MRICATLRGGRGALHVLIAGTPQGADRRRGRPVAPEVRFTAGARSEGRGGAAKLPDQHGNLWRGLMTSDCVSSGSCSRTRGHPSVEREP